ncbi:hypothetical protein HDU97_003328 [Phlyctochytrium planicorne]|nr:hypothetical protein HDU97_003328 [Phlyctochytrium planicorne]
MTSPFVRAAVGLAAASSNNGLGASTSPLNNAVGGLGNSNPDNQAKGYMPQAVAGDNNANNQGFVSSPPSGNGNLSPSFNTNSRASSAQGGSIYPNSIPGYLIITQSRPTYLPTTPYPKCGGSLTVGCFTDNFNKALAACQAQYYCGAVICSEKSPICYLLQGNAQLIPENYQNTDVFHTTFIPSGRSYKLLSQQSSSGRYNSAEKLGYSMLLLLVPALLSALTL